MAKEARVSLWARSKRCLVLGKPAKVPAGDNFTLSYTSYPMRLMAPESGGKWAMEVLSLYPFPQILEENSAREIFLKYKYM